MTTPQEKQDHNATASAMTAAAAAIALADKTHETAVALANAKAASDVSAAILTNHIGYIKEDIGEIKESLKSIKADFVTHREFTDSLKAIEDKIKPLRNLLWGMIGLTLSAVFAAILKLVILQ